MDDPTRKATEIKLRYERKWLDIAWVTAVGIGLVDNTLVIIVSVESNVEFVRAQIPTQIEGVPVMVKLTGKLRAQ
ncbi:MAG TPA: hypothetical protein VJ203_09295 [Bacteroidales bacterium]|nr:hypothetical protein [Bacteroidales bacterium]